YPLSTASIARMIAKLRGKLIHSQGLACAAKEPPVNNLVAFGLGHKPEDGDESSLPRRVLQHPWGDSWQIGATRAGDCRGCCGFGLPRGDGARVHARRDFETGIKSGHGAFEELV